MNISALAKRAASFNANIKLHEATAIQLSEKVLVGLNRSQMLASKNAKDKTITPKYSFSYASYKGFSNPNLKDTGDFQKNMFLIAKHDEYFINSIDWKAPILEVRYADIFGIAPSNNKKASQEASRNLGNVYKKLVWIN
jgi:hypothetical protein